MDSPCQLGSRLCGSRAPTPTCRESWPPRSIQLRRVDRSGYDRGREVLDEGEGVVEVMQGVPPPLVGRRAAEALGVVPEPLPFDEEQEAARSFDASLDPQRHES